MQALRVTVVSLSILALAVPLVADHHEGALMKEVEAIGDRLAEAMVAADIETVLGMYTEDAISLPNYEARIDGLEAFRKRHAEMAASGMKIASFASDPTDVWDTGDHVIEIGKYEITLEMPGMPEPIGDHGKYMTVYVRDADDHLKIKVETWNTDVNPMQMAGHGHDH